MIEEKFDAIVVGAGPSGQRRRLHDGQARPQGSAARARRISGLEERAGRDPLRGHARKDHPGLPRRRAAGAPHHRAAHLDDWTRRPTSACTTARRTSTRRSRTATRSSARSSTSGSREVREAGARRHLRNDGHRPRQKQRRQGDRRATDRDGGIVSSPMSSCWREGVNGLIGQRAGLRPTPKPDTSRSR